MSTNPVLETPRPRSPARLPYVEPVVLVPRSDPFDDPEWVFEPHYEGIRGLVYASDVGCEIRSRRDILLKRYRDLWGRVAEILGEREAILDGEIVSLNRQGRPDYQDLVRRQGFIAFAAFDLLWLDGRDLRDEPLAVRKELLGDLLPEDTGPLYKILTIEEHGRALFGAIRKMELGGVVAKRKTDTYTPGTVWYRIRNPGYMRPEGRVGPRDQRERLSHSDSTGKALRP
jgi:bifunctional non-homologous end joining protein LigD